MKIDQRTYSFARERLEDAVEAFFDDPVGYCDSLSGDELKVRAKETIDELEFICKDLGLNWKALILKASAYEIRRMMRLVTELNVPEVDAEHLEAEEFKKSPVFKQYIKDMFGEDD